MRVGTNLRQITDCEDEKLLDKSIEQATLLRHDVAMTYNPVLESFHLNSKDHLKLRQSPYDFSNAVNPQICQCHLVTGRGLSRVWELPYIIIIILGQRSTKVHSSGEPY